MVGEGAVDDDEIGIDEIFDRQVFLNESAKEFADFFFGIALDAFVEVLVLSRVDGDGIVAFKVGPLVDETIAEVVGFGIGEQAVDLLRVDFGIGKVGIEEFVVGRAAPEEVGKADGELAVVEEAVGFVLFGNGFLNEEEAW